MFDDHKKAQKGWEGLKTILDEIAAEYQKTKIRFKYCSKF
jgi:hypothetical protein